MDEQMRRWRPSGMVPVPVAMAIAGLACVVCLRLVDWMQAKRLPPPPKGSGGGEVDRQWAARDRAMLQMIAAEAARLGRHAAGCRDALAAQGKVATASRYAMLGSQLELLKQLAAQPWTRPQPDREVPERALPPWELLRRLRVQLHDLDRVTGMAERGGAEVAAPGAEAARPPLHGVG
jgi:hypothetical protein